MDATTRAPTVGGEGPDHEAVDTAREGFESGFKAFVHLLEALVHLLEAFVDLLEAFVHLLEALVDLLEALVYLLKALVDLLETLFHLLQDGLDQLALVLQLFFDADHALAQLDLLDSLRLTEGLLYEPLGKVVFDELDVFLGQRHGAVSFWSVANEYIRMRRRERVVVHVWVLFKTPSDRLHRKRKMGSDPVFPLFFRGHRR
ncbi:MAG: hypothetical protein K9M02_19020 [Thiohalocapsa sp.]|nr:hypothetical protein [Thiohalocapsa sp.]